MHGSWDFLPSVTCGVWMGYDNRQSLGEKETGAKAALPIWMDFMKVAIADKPDETFPTDTKHPPGPEKQIATAAKPEPKPASKAGSPSQPAQP